MSLEVLLVEPYAAGSHLAWAEGYAAHSAHHVRLVTHEGNFWRWRLRGSALTLADLIADDVARHGPPDVLLVSDMTDLPALLGYTRRVLGDPAVAAYFHENQLLYPELPDHLRRQRVERDGGTESLALINWLTLAAADHVFFNSTHHRDALLAALPTLLSRAPDHPHAAHLPEVEGRSSVLPVGVDLTVLSGARPPGDGGSPLVVWNQRWDHDKDPQRFFRALFELAEEGVPFRVAIAGENGRVDPQEFDEAVLRLGDRVTSVGHLPRDRYLDLLQHADVVVSTARHEFFGVAMVEAMAAGAVPLLPNRLSYPELVPAWSHDAVLYEGTAMPGRGELRVLVERLRAVLADVEAARREVEGLRSHMCRFGWDTVAPQYDAALVDVVDQRRVLR